MTYSKIICGIDGSETSIRALRRAAEVAKGEGALLITICAYTPPDERTLKQWKEEAPAEVSWRMTQTAVAEEALERARAAAGEMGVEPEGRAVEGDPADAIIETAEKEGADLIVVGSVGMTGAKRFLLGSVPNKISHHAPCDVLIVKTA